MSVYDKVIVTRPELQHEYLKGRILYISGINHNSTDFAGYDPCMNGLPLFDLMDEQGNSIHSLLYQYEVSLAS